MTSFISSFSRALMLLCLPSFRCRITSISHGHYMLIHSFHCNLSHKEHIKSTIQLHNGMFLSNSIKLNVSIHKSNENVFHLKNSFSFLLTWPPQFPLTRSVFFWLCILIKQPSCRVIGQRMSNFVKWKRKYEENNK